MRYIVLLLAGVVLAVLLVAYLPPATGVKITPSGSDGPTANHKHRRPSKLVVKRPWRAGRPQKGIAIYFKALPNPTKRRVRAAAKQTFDYAVRLGANSVSLSFPFFTGGLRSNQVF